MTPSLDRMIRAAKLNAVSPSITTKISKEKS